VPVARKLSLVSEASVGVTTTLLSLASRKISLAANNSELDPFRFHAFIFCVC
jgi:hypothetical protein